MAIQSEESNELAYILASIKQELIKMLHDEITHHITPDSNHSLIRLTVSYPNLEQYCCSFIPVKGGLQKDCTKRYFVSFADPDFLLKLKTIVIECLRHQGTERWKECGYRILGNCENHSCCHLDRCGLEKKL